MKKKFLKLFPVFQSAFTDIDLDSGVIPGVAIATEGEIKGHGMYADSVFIQQVVDSANEQPQGVKARFGHPNMCYEAMGTYLGRFTNYRVEGDKAIADLQLDDSAKQSPNGDLHQYVLKMASDNPDMFGTSIVFKPARSEHKEIEVGNDGETEEREFARLESLLATDIVDSPAANEGLFSQFSHDDIAFQITDFLDNHPEIWEIVDANPEAYEEFLGRYAAYKEQTNPTGTDLNSKFKKLQKFVTDKLSELRGSASGSTEVKILDNAELISKMAEFTAIVEEANTKLGEKEAKVTELEGKITTLKAEAVTAANEIARLSGTGAGSDNGGEEGAGSEGGEEGNNLWSFMAKRMNKKRS